MGKDLPCALFSKNTTEDIVIVQDSDLEYDPKEYTMRVVVQERADAVHRSNKYGGKCTLEFSNNQVSYLLVAR